MTTTSAEMDVINPLENAGPVCFGQYDVIYKECTVECAMSTQCKRMTEQAPKAAPPSPPLETVDKLPEMSPYDFLFESLKGRYDVEVEIDKDTSTKILICYKDNSSVIRIKVTKTGHYFFHTHTKTQLEIQEIESVKQASEIFKAILIV